MKRNTKRSNEDKVQLSFLDKEKANLIDNVEDGDMVAILSGMEVMYVFLYGGEYRCVIHKFDSEDARQKAFERNARNRATLNHLNSAADHLFLVKFQKGMDLVGVMVAAERGIISFLDQTGQLPAEDADFMSWKDNPDDTNKEEKQ